MRADDRIDDRSMAAVRDGDLDAMAPLFERHHRRLYGFFRHSSGDPALAEELTQEVFLRVLRYRRSYRRGQRFESWLYRIARNVLADGRPPVLERAGIEDPDARASGAPSPAASFEDAEAAERLRRALASLDPSDREVLVLARFQELRHDRIAELLGCSSGAVKVRVHRAMKRLAKRMKTGVFS